jgi:hypothetical protein
MSKDFDETFSVRLPDVSGAYSRIFMKCAHAILGNRELAEVFFLATEGLHTDLPSTNRLRKRLELLIARFCRRNWAARRHCSEFLPCSRSRRVVHATSCPFVRYGRHAPSCPDHALVQSCSYAAVPLPEMPNTGIRWRVLAGDRETGHWRKESPSDAPHIFYADG